MKRIAAVESFFSPEHRAAIEKAAAMLLFEAIAAAFCTFRQENASDFLAHRHIPSTFRENLTGKAGSAIMLPDQS